MTMYKKTMREALQEVSSYKLEEEVELDEALNPKDKKVVDAFYDGRSMDGKMLSTDGKKLEKTGMGVKQLHLNLAVSSRLLQRWIVVLLKMW